MYKILYWFNIIVILRRKERNQNIETLFGIKDRIAGLQSSYLMGSFIQLDILILKSKQRAHWTLIVEKLEFQSEIQTYEISVECKRTQIALVRNLEETNSFARHVCRKWNRTICETCVPTELEWCHFFSTTVSKMGLFSTWISS